MQNDFYKDVAKLRLITADGIMQRSKRAREAILKSVDAELTRIANSVKKGYTLGPNRMEEVGEFYRPYKYFNIKLTVIQDLTEFESHGVKIQHALYAPEMTVKITRGDFTLTITEENINQLHVWCNHWKAVKPNTIEECDDDKFYMRWW